MAVLKEVREKESEIDNLIGPIEEMYGLLMRYEVRVPKEETTMVSDLRYGWKKLRKLATDVSDNLTRLQVRASVQWGAVVVGVGGVGSMMWDRGLCGCAFPWAVHGFDVQHSVSASFLLRVLCLLHTWP